MHLPALACIRTQTLELFPDIADKPPVSVIYLDITSCMDRYNTPETLEFYFPCLETLAYSVVGQVGAETMQHSTVRALTLYSRYDPKIPTARDNSQQRTIGMWKQLSVHLRAITVVRFPSLRFLVLKFPDRLNTRRRQKGMDKMTYHLRDAGIQVEK